MQRWTRWTWIIGFPYLLKSGWAWFGPWSPTRLRYEAMMDLHPDFSDLLVEFASADVCYALLGGYAVAYHGRPRATKDLDLLVSGRTPNLERVASALRSFGAPPNVVSAARQQHETEVIYLGVPPLRIDILRSVDGLDTEAALERVIRGQVGDVLVPILSLDDLITNKRASARPQDLADAVALEHIRARTKTDG